MKIMAVDSRSLAVALCAALSAVLCACATPPKPEAPHAAIADTALGLAGAAAPAVGDTWWQGFGDAQLDRLIEQALSDNPGLAQAVRGCGWPRRRQLRPEPVGSRRSSSAAEKRG